VSTEALSKKPTLVWEKATSPRGWSTRVAAVGLLPLLQLRACLATEQLAQCAGAMSTTWPTVQCRLTALATENALVFVCHTSLLLLGPLLICPATMGDGPPRIEPAV
jgi:hypothetical protein